MLRLLDIIFPPRVDEMVLRDVSVDKLLSHLAPKIIPITRPASVMLLPFTNASVRATIHEAKYHGSNQAFSLLAEALAEYLNDCDNIEHTSYSLVPVPLGKERQRERGFNQVEEVAKRALSLLNEESTERFHIETNLLERIRETISQVSLTRNKREKNMRGAFGATHPTDPNRTYIIIDDVITTGATLQACVGALTKAGAVNIIPLALAH